MEVNATQTMADLESRRIRRLIGEYHDSQEPDAKADLPAWADVLERQPVAVKIKNGPAKGQVVYL